MDLSKIKKRDILKSPQREWCKTTEYESILIVPANTKHDSGYMHIAVIGIKDNNNELEICAYPDDICWDYTGFKQQFDYNGVRTDCYYPSGLLHFWGRNLKFQVQEALSSTTIKVINKLITNKK